MKTMTQIEKNLLIACVHADMSCAAIRQMQAWKIPLDDLKTRQLLVLETKKHNGKAVGALSQKRNAKNLEKLKEWLTDQITNN